MRGLSCNASETRLFTPSTFMLSSFMSTSEYIEIELSQISNAPLSRSGSLFRWQKTKNTDESLLAALKSKLDNMNIEGVNSLVSDALHLSPRITRQLSEVLHHKTMGNPLFVKQLLASLTAQGYIYVDMSQPKWTWDLNKIADQEISESVLALLVDEMERLPSDLQLGLKLASCLGSRVQNNVLDILSKDLGIDLLGILQQVSEKGFMSNEDGMMFSFTHDKIQQAGE